MLDLGCNGLHEISMLTFRLASTATLKKEDLCIGNRGVQERKLRPRPDFPFPAAYARIRIMHPYATNIHARAREKAARF